MIVFDVEKVYQNMTIESLEQQRQACVTVKDTETLQVIDRILKARENARV